MPKTIEFRTTQRKFDLQPVESDPNEGFDLKPIETNLAGFDLQPAVSPEKPEQYPDIYGDFDVWAAPPDSQIWKSPGADFIKGFGGGWIRQTQIPALMGKKLPPPASKAEKIGEMGGRMMEVITEFIGLGAVLRGVGLLPKTLPKGALAIEKALHTGVLFGTQQATEEVRKATAEAIYDEDFGSRGGTAVLESFALGAILSLAFSGVGATWNKLKPTEQARALKTLGLKKGATLHEINKAARIQARRFHPDKVKGMREQFDKVIEARDALRKANAKDIIIANAKQNFKKGLIEKIGVSEDVANIAIQRLDAGESITKVDQMLSQAKLGIKPLVDQPITAEDLQVEKAITEIDKQAERHLKSIREEAKTPLTRGRQGPDIAPERLLPAEVAEIPPIAPKAEPEAKTQIEKLYGKANKFIQDIYEGKNLSPQEKKIYDSAKTIGDKTTATARIISERGKAGKISEETLGQLEWVLHPTRDLETGEMIDPFNFEGGAPRSYQVEIAIEELDDLYKQAKPEAVEAAPKRTKLLTEDEVHSIMSESLDENEYTMYLQDEFQARTTGDQEVATRAFDKEAQVMFERGYLYNEKQNQWARVSAEFKAEVEAVEVAPEAIEKTKTRIDEAFKEDNLKEIDKIERELEASPYSEEADKLLAGLIPLRLEMEMQHLEELSDERLQKIARDNLVFGEMSRKEIISQIREIRPAQPPTLAKAEPAPAAPERGVKKTIEELQAEIDSYLKEQKNPPMELLAEFNAARKKGAKEPPDQPEPGVTFKEPPRPEGPNVLMVAEVEKRLDEKAMLSEKRKLRPGARRLAKKFVGKTELKKMTEEELATFGQIIGKLPEPTYNNKGQRIPPSIPKTTAITKAGEFEREYKKPTIPSKWVHAPEYYAEKLGVKSLVEKAEAGKIRFDMEYQQLSNKVDGWIKQIDKLGGTKLSEKAQAKLKNLPTKAVARFRELLDTNDEPPESLNPKEKELFNNFRGLTRWLLKRENAVRESLELESIQYRKAYVRHVAKGMAKEMMNGRYPFPQGRKFWAEEIVAKKIYNPMEMHRTMTEDLEELFSRDLGFATKSMLWTALKEIHLSQPIRYLEQQLTAKGKDTPIYKTLSPSEQAKWDKVATIPSRTRRWVKDYVNTTIKGQQSLFDQDVEATVKNTGLNGLLNKLLRPFGRALSHKPVSNFVREAGRAQILGVLGGPIGGRPRQIMRNKFQTLQSMALYPLYKETWRTYAPIRALRKTTPDLERLLDKSLFLKAYTGTEEWPVDIKSKIAKASLRAYQWSAVSNARQGMETAYWGMMPLFNKPKFKHYGWADPKRTYEEKPEFLYPSEEKLMLKEMEFGAAATQHNYTPIGMPEIFRHKTLTPITRLQSWWMNHYFRFTEEAMRRGFTGKPTYSKEGGPILPWKYRLGWLRYALIAVPILNIMRYQRSYFFGAAPTGVPPFAQFAQGMYNYVVGKGASNDQQWKRGKKQMIQSGKTFIPGYMSYKDFEAIWSGRKDLDSLFFYKKR